MTAAIEVEQLVNTYPGKILTTLSRPDSGRARVAGHDVLGDPGAVRRAVRRPGALLGWLGRHRDAAGLRPGHPRVTIVQSLIDLNGGSLALRYHH